MGLPDQLKLPYSDGYEIGLGVNFASGGPKNEAVMGAITAPRIAQGAIVEYRVLRVYTTSEIEQLLEISANASYGVAAFCGVEGRFRFTKSAKVQSSSLVMMVFASVRRAFQQIDNVELNGAASEVADQPNVFAERYGNMFVRGMSTGGLFCGYFRIDTGSAQISDDISIKLAGSYGLFSGEAETKFKEVQRDFRSEIAVDMYHEGGPVDLKINSLDDPMELIRTVKLFLSSFNERPDEVSVPYSVTLSPLSIANGPVPPNAAELQHAQDVLIHCAGRRSPLIDQLNTFQHIVDKPHRFDFSNGAKREEISLAAETVQSDLDLIARCASHAMNDPKTAQFPEDFATKVGVVYPKTKVPQILPDPIPLQVATIPNLIGQSIDIVSSGLMQLGLVADPQPKQLVKTMMEVLERQGKRMNVVFAQYPPAGTPTNPGARVQYTYYSYIPSTRPSRPPGTPIRALGRARPR
jgi:hypothetical protein